MTLQQDIEGFLTFMNKYGGTPLNYRDGNLITLGCEGTMGGCCSKQYDLQDLAEVLTALVEPARG
jgi:hypothetical protein